MLACEGFSRVSAEMGIQIMNIRVAVFFVSLLLLAAGPINAADESQYKPLQHKFQVYLGGFFPDVSSKITINGEVLPPGPGLDLEEVFGLEDSKALLWGGARWRISRRNHLEFEFVNLNRDGTRTAISEDIQIGDSIVKVGGRVDSTFDITLARLTYGFSLVRNDRMDIQLKAGLHLADLSTSLTLSGAACEVTMPGQMDCIGGAVPVVESQDITAPLPHFGGSFVYGITPSIAARLQIIGFAIELDKIDGSLVELDADFIWQPWDHFGFGVGLRYFDTNIESKSSDLNGKFEFDYFGPTLYVFGTF